MTLGLLTPNFDDEVVFNGERTMNKIRTLTAAMFSTALLFSVSGASFANDYQPKTGAMSESDSAQPGTDTWITAKVKADLLATDGVDGSKINVTTINGVVTLAGVLETQMQVDKAISVTRGIEGVKGLETKALKTAGANMASDQPGSDTWITTKVKGDLLVTEGVDGTKINVTTVNGVVTLAGVLDTQAQVTKAIDVTRAIEGVKSVETKALKSR